MSHCKKSAPHCWHPDAGSSPDEMTVVPVTCCQCGVTGNASMIEEERDEMAHGAEPATAFSGPIRLQIEED